MNPLPSSLFSSKDKSEKIIVLSAATLLGSVRVNSDNYISVAKEAV